MLISFDLSEVGRAKLEQEGAFAVKIVSATEWISDYTDDEGNPIAKLLVTFVTKEDLEISDFVPLKGKGAYRLLELATACEIDLSGKKKFNTQSFENKKLVIHVKDDENYGLGIENFKSIPRSEKAPVSKPAPEVKEAPVEEPTVEEVIEEVFPEPVDPGYIAVEDDEADDEFAW